jgi:hypothetical protein
LAIQQNNVSAQSSEGNSFQIAIVSDLELLGLRRPSR